jgi:Fatty acid synthase type I helical domain
MFYDILSSRLTTVDCEITACCIAIMNRADPHLINFMEFMVNLLRLLSYLVFTRFAYASYLPYLYDRTVSTAYRTHFGLCRYLDT